MKLYGIWCNVRKGWYTNGKNFLNGGPKTWSLRANAVACMDNINYWQTLYSPPGVKSIDLRIVEFNVTPVDNKHLI